MNLQNAWEEFEVSENLYADLAYLETLWNYAFKMSGDQDWLFGAYSLADVFSPRLRHELPVISCQSHSKRSSMLTNIWPIKIFASGALWNLRNTTIPSLQHALRLCALARPTHHSGRIRPRAV